jgi:hypothetical protein
VNPDVLEKLIELDSRGFLMTGSESAEEFLQRIRETGEVYAAFENELAEKGRVKVFDAFDVSADNRIAPELSREAADITRKLYGFEVSHVPGFYLTRQIGLLWGGCLIGDPEQNFAVFLLRNAFKKQQRFLNYRREELLAHELCHSVRHVLNEPMLEEYFAYQTSPSPLRRYLGNCFISDKDAWGFLLPVLLLPAAELVKALWYPWFPGWIFWILAVVYPLYLLFRNHCSRKLVKKAAAVLSAGGVKRVEPVLFRCTYAELQEFAAAKPEDAAGIAGAKAEKSPRWQVIVKRFFQSEEEEQDNENRIND